MNVTIKSNIKTLLLISLVILVALSMTACGKKSKVKEVTKVEEVKDEYKIIETSESNVSTQKEKEGTQVNVDVVLANNATDEELLSKATEIFISEKKKYEEANKDNSSLKSINVFFYTDLDKFELKDSYSQYSKEVNKETLLVRFYDKKSEHLKELKALNKDKESSNEMLENFEAKKLLALDKNINEFGIKTKALSVYISEKENTFFKTYTLKE